MDEEAAAQRKAEYDAAIMERLALDPTDHPDGPLIDLKDVAILGGLAKGSPGMARQRTRKGQAKILFPEPDEDEGSRWEDKPLWRAHVILDYFKRTGNWPLGAAARASQRVQRAAPKTPAAPAATKVTWTQLSETHPALAEMIRAAKLNDGARRSPDQWSHRYEHTNGQRHEVVHTVPARPKRDRSR